MPQCCSCNTEIALLRKRLEDGHDRRWIDLGVRVEQKEQVARCAGHAVIRGGGETVGSRKSNHYMPGILPQNRMGGIVGASIVDDDDLIRLRIAEPQCGQTPQRLFAVLVCGDYHRDAEVRFHAVNSSYQGFAPQHRAPHSFCVFYHSGGQRDVAAAAPDRDRENSTKKRPR